MKTFAFALLAGVIAGPALAGGDVLVVPKEDLVIKFEEPTLEPIPGFEPTEQYNTYLDSATLPGDYWFEQRRLYQLDHNGNIVYVGPNTQR